MRTSPSASLAPWPTRILRPWLVASAAGFSLGFLLLFAQHAAEAAADAGDPGPLDFSPRAAVADPDPTAPLLQPDPFAPASALAAPPDTAPVGGAAGAVHAEDDLLLP